MDGISRMQVEGKMPNPFILIILCTELYPWLEMDNLFELICKMINTTIRIQVNRQF